MRLFRFESAQINKPLGEQAYAQAGYVPIYVGLVTDEPPPPVRIPSPRLVRGTGL